MNDNYFLQVEVGKKTRKIFLTFPFCAALVFLFQHFEMVFQQKLNTRVWSHSIGM